MSCMGQCTSQRLICDHDNTKFGLERRISIKQHSGVTMGTMSF
jgi:hypothetical protein